MEIRAFTPIIFTNDDAAIIAQFEAMGFEKRHTKDMAETNSVVSTVMKDGNGHTVCTVKGAGFPQTFTGIRVMVDDYDKAIEEFTKMGYVNIQGKGKSDTGTSVATLLRSPEGLFVSVAQHLR